jgi:aminoglycoside/choline kinase family phosphotransferase
MPDARHDALCDFIATHLGTAAGAPEPASSDASFRRYWRVRDGAGTQIIMDAPPEKEDCSAFVDIAARLQGAGLRVPAVHAWDREQGFLWLDDMGTQTVLQVLDSANVEAIYAAALDSLLQMQLRVDSTGLPRYDENRLRDEMELLPRWFLQQHLAVELDCHDYDRLEQAFLVLIHNARVQPQVFVHRDFHSRNLMHGTPPALLDFQDAVIGPITYDLVSLLKDCYVRWPPDQVAAWAEGYRQQLAQAGVVVPDARRWQRWFDLMGLQRHLKVLGIFARLWHRDGKEGYLADLPRVLQYALEVCERYLELQQLGRCLHRWTEGVDLTRSTGKQR